MIVPTVTLPFLNRRGSLSNALPREHQGTPLQFHCNVYCRGGACSSRNVFYYIILSCGAHQPLRRVRRLRRTETFWPTPCRGSTEALPYNFAVTLCRVYDDRLFCTVMYDGDKRYRTPKNRIAKPFSAPCTIKTVIDGGTPPVLQRNRKRRTRPTIIHSSIFSFQSSVKQKAFPSGERWFC